MSERINSVDFWVDELTRDTNPDHFDFHEKIIPYMHDEKISKFGSWMWSSGYNVGLFNLQAKVNTYCIPQWISVKDRLPEPHTVVLVHYTDGRICTADYIDEYLEFITSSTITHWMPLPTPPESEDDAK